MGKPTYFKRYRMELDLRLPRPRVELPNGFRWIPWSPELLDAHAHMKFRCFAGETDSVVFPCLSNLGGCRDLMKAISTRAGFCPAATWLVYRAGEGVGTVQGLTDSSRWGSIQNLGVLPEYRGLGIGLALLVKALNGFAAHGAKRASLEVTARNETAIRIYRGIGFRSRKTIYREVVVHEPAPETEQYGEPLEVVL